jgi:hypothetical protein
VTDHPAPSLALTDEVAARTVAEAKAKDASRALRDASKRSPRFAIVVGAITLVAIAAPPLWKLVEANGAPSIHVGRDDAVTKDDLAAVESRLTSRIDALYALMAGRPPK